MCCFSSRASSNEAQISPTSTPALKPGAFPTSSSANSMSGYTAKDRRVGEFGNYRRELSSIDGGSSSAPRGHPIVHHSQPSLQVAPWMTPPNGSNNGFFEDIADSMSIHSQNSPALGPATFRGSRGHGPSASFDANMPDAMYLDNDRRPSAASINTTASSQGSRTSGTRGGLRKLQGFFGEEFPGRESPDANSLSNSLSGAMSSTNHFGTHSHSFSIGTSKDQRSRSYSHTRLPQRDRNYSNATDREASPASSRPRTPLPAPEVVPFLYQDNSVSLISFFLSVLFLIAVSTTTICLDLSKCDNSGSTGLAHWLLWATRLRNLASLHSPSPRLLSLHS